MKTSGVQVAAEKWDQHKAAFTTLFGLYEHLEMIMGVCHGTANFQRSMQAIMSDLISQIMFTSSVTHQRLNNDILFLKQGW